MKIVNDNATLRIVDSTRLLGAFCLVWAGLVAAFLLNQAMTHKLKSADLLGFGLMALLPLVAGVVNWDRTDFQFDKNTRMLVWRRQRLFRPQGGKVPFSAIHSAEVEATFAAARQGPARPGHRLVLHLGGDLSPVTVLPITGGYVGGAHQARCVEAAARIREILSDTRP